MWIVDNPENSNFRELKLLIILKFPGHPKGQGHLILATHCKIDAGQDREVEGTTTIKTENHGLIMTMTLCKLSVKEPGRARKEMFEQKMVSKEL